MTLNEFDKMTMLFHGQIPPELYAVIEHLYMADDDYHAAHGGVDESKVDFCQRVFGGQVNSPRSLVAKLVKEYRKIRRWRNTQNVKLRRGSDWEDLQNSRVLAGLGRRPIVIRIRGGGLKWDF